MRMRILLIDDHAMFRAGLRRILEDDIQDVVIGEAADVPGALDQLRSSSWDVVMIDISLPGRSGLDLIPEIRQSWPETRMIVLSSFGDPQFAVKAIHDGAAAFLTKERAPQELLDAIRTVASGRRFISAELAEQLAAVIASDAPAEPHETLSSRELEVFRLIASARSLSEIAAELGLSPKTVSTYRSRILEKMGLSTNAELMQYAIRRGLVE